MILSNIKICPRFAILEIACGLECRDLLGNRSRHELIDAGSVLTAQKLDGFFL